ncbi:MAG: ribosome-associated translation inhibitor RaiA [bacterium]
MRIIIKGDKIKLTNSIKQYIEEKIGGLERFLKSFNPELIEARVEVGKITHGQKHGDIFRAEVNLNIDGKFIRVEKTENSLLAAIDFAKDELSREIRQFKNKKSTKFIRGARSWKKFWQISPLARIKSSKVMKIIRRK